MHYELSQALCYKRDVAEPTEREGNPVPKWGWKEVRAHYELHSTSNFVARHKMIRQLQNMRAQQEERIVRVDNGEKELDRQGADCKGFCVEHCIEFHSLETPLTNSF